MKQEPVAWMYYDDWNKLKLGQTMPPDPNWFPVYTHPVKEYTPNQTLECSFDLAGFKPPVKELTDEEIKILATKARVDFSVPSYIEFARTIEKAILRKAQEK